MDWRIVSQYLLRKCMGNELPAELQSKSHFFYGLRVVSIADDLPKKDWLYRFFPLIPGNVITCQTGDYPTKPLPSF
jgi:hypothetical protein